MKKNRIALKPYVEAVENICRPLSKEQLVELVLKLAQDESSSGRLEFLDRIKTWSPGTENMIKAVADVDHLLDNIQALKEDILERIEAIENGDYEALDDWDWEDGYDDDEPDLISDEQSDDLADLFAEAGALFLKGDTREARMVYDALFGLMAELENSDFYLPYPDLDWREERARHARCVYDDSDETQRITAFADAMNLDASFRYDRMENNTAYPMLCDVMDARQEKMAGLEGFYPAWKSLLEKKGLEGRPSSLLLETVLQTEGESEVEKLARAWGSAQPNGYLFWLDLLMNGNLKAAVEMVKVSRSLGWSYGLNVGLVFGCVAAAASGYETGADAIKQVLDRGLDHRYAYSYRFAVADEKKPPLFFYNEILNGLKAANLSEYHTGQDFKWAEEIGRKRVDDIVSNTHRGAYDRAAMVLGSLAEVFTAKGETETAQNLFHEFCKQK
jgi:hypothetical protein